ncbi:SH3, type 3 domain protein [Magnetococcus marinus MC-1]|uniref:SH3, type 3 domain protein n=1 Tax=Magnetococcus marinus (strain ATCC BAA-1437 / JCM 17883 / MC-1) TaxID=156889 RepID=A0LDX5_MAGMM|nr:TIGR04211 family SH3 domain-containing protein [Magnetococcus marinus]ABK46168.1 SH3, type 3 domain protein [Magnetococcus marinus MC-1]
MGSLRPSTKRLASLLLTTLFVVGFGISSSAATRYVTDEFRIMMRGGAGNQFRILQVLKSGEGVEILEKGDQGWDRVRSSSGRDGWVLRRYLSEQPAARTLLDQAVAQKDQALRDRDGLQEQLAELRGQLINQRRLESELMHIKRISKNALELEKINQTLEQRVAALEQELQTVTADKRVLEKSSETQFFLSGAVVLTLGMIAGAILRRRGKQTPYDALM